MVLENNRDLVLRRLVECLGRDRTRHQVAEVTSLGLVQMTRKRISTGLLEAFSHTCEHCQGRGVIVEGEPIDPKKHEDHGSNGSRGATKRSSNRRRSGRRGGEDNGQNGSQTNDAGSQGSHEDRDSSSDRDTPDQGDSAAQQGKPEADRNAGRGRGNGGGRDAGRDQGSHATAADTTEVTEATGQVDQGAARDAAPVVETRPEPAPDAAPVTSPGNADGVPTADPSNDPSNARATPPRSPSSTCLAADRSSYGVVGVLRIHGVEPVRAVRDRWHLRRQLTCWTPTAARRRRFDPGGVGSVDLILGVLWHARPSGHIAPSGARERSSSSGAGAVPRFTP